MSKTLLVLIVAAAAGLSGCQSSPSPAGAAAAKPSPKLEKAVLTTPAPENAMGVSAAKQNVKNGDEVCMKGRVKDFMEGIAGFVMTDVALKSCEDKCHGCPTPWDYCCTPPEELAAASATVQLIGHDGEPIEGGLKGVRSIDHLTTVVVEGKAKRDEGGNLLVFASKIYVKK